ncbi:VanZ family protein [Cryptosporangium aurantiacum]|uniref:VanZ like family protein n=1 Tax=Cryptosporangium aurantiacum TaxID=134849 RepID=A0A1M7I9W6_9ACTN|nr:VanZ family protein [Cryptosporangium aurantiacum]SHM37552.1 VanZ like family protein [Cryptosporangium aurantiacum]
MTANVETTAPKAIDRLRTRILPARRVRPARAAKERRRPFLRIGPFLLLLVYLAIMAAVTLGPGDPEAAAGAAASDNFTPFAEINRSLDDGSLRALAQVLGNALLFVPFGVLVPLSFPRLRVLTAVLAAAAASACVELVQLTHLAGRMFDIDDVILNVTGAFLGGLLVAVWRGITALARLVRRSEPVRT